MKFYRCLFAKTAIKNQRGLATLEMIPIMVVIALLLNFALGFFGVIQTGILNSIASRNYAFETFRNRTNLVYFHDVRADGNSKKRNSRVHGIASDSRQGTSEAQVTIRRIGFGLNPQSTGDNGIHEPGPGEGRGIFGIKQNVRNDSIESAPVWVRPMYGICLNAQCSQ